MREEYLSETHPEERRLGEYFFLVEMVWRVHIQRREALESTFLRGSWSGKYFSRGEKLWRILFGGGDGLESSFPEERSFGDYFSRVLSTPNQREKMAVPTGMGGAPRIPWHIITPMNTIPRH